MRRTFALSVAILTAALACGRTQPTDEVPVPPSSVDAGRDGGVADAGDSAKDDGKDGGQDSGEDAGADPRLIVAVVDGVATAYALDGQIVWTVPVGEVPLPDAGPRLVAGAGRIGWLDTRSDGGWSLGVTSRDGETSTLAGPGFDATALWGGPGGFSASNGRTGVVFHADASVATDKPPVGPPSDDGFVPVARSGRLSWTPLDGGPERRATFGYVPGLPGDWAIYFPSGDYIVQSLSTFDVGMKPGLSSITVRRVAIDRVVLSDRTAASAVFRLVEFGRGMAWAIGFPATATRLGTAQLDLPAIDAQGRLFQPFDVDGDIVVQASADHGNSWTPVVELPGDAGLTAFALDSFGGELVTGGASAIANGNVEWRALLATPLDGGASFSLPLAQRSTPLAVQPWAMTADGALVAFWAPAPGGVVLSVFETASRQLRALGLVRPVAAVGAVPELVWLE